MEAKILLSGVLGLLEINGLILQSPTLAQNPIKAAISYPVPSVISTASAKNLPQNLEIAVREKMAQQLEINSKLLKLNKSQLATWVDCLPDKTGLIPPQPCAGKSLSGWRVTMSSPSENWIYYVTNNGFITLDAPASLNKTILSNLSTRLRRKPNQIRILAAELTKGLPPCPINATCKVKPILGWRILVEGREKPFFLGLDGKDLNYGNLSLYLPQETAQLPRNLGEKVLEDVVSRQNNLNPQLRVESIKTIKWNMCQGGGPTRPDMGTCANVDVEDWQMVVISGANRYVYYIPKNASSDPNFSPRPDGIQSLSNSLVSAIQKDAAKRAKVPANMINLRWAEPQFFDKCLNLDNQKLNCRQSISAGWQITALGGNIPSNSKTTPGAVASWIYHVNLSGNDIRFLRSGVWTPIP